MRTTTVHWTPWSPLAGVNAKDSVEALVAVTQALAPEAPLSPRPRVLVGEDQRSLGEPSFLHLRRTVRTVSCTPASLHLPPPNVFESIVPFSVDPPDTGTEGTNVTLRSWWLRRENEGLYWLPGRARVLAFFRVFSLTCKTASCSNEQKELMNTDIVDVPLP